MSLSRKALRQAYEDACRREIEALKPGNVHVFADGHRMTASQFLQSAAVSSEPLTDPDLRLGRRILEAVRATRKAVDTNTNLGIILLCAPLLRAAEIGGADIRQSTRAVLDDLDGEDTAAVFEAIVLASPGGLGSADHYDVRDKPSVGLLHAMAEAANRDRIAQQYVSGFDDIFAVGLPEIDAALARGEGGMWPAVFCFMAFLSRFPDSHVGRKHGAETAEAVREEAAVLSTVLAATENEGERIELLLQFDRRLKERSVNPGTSADLTVASLLADVLRSTLHRSSIDA
jgi:triphosphoribosyl-dephospho-CoA synthase